MDFNSTVQKSNRGKTVVLDSDYRGGAILYAFTASLLLAYSITSIFLWQEVRLKPSQGVTVTGATAMFGISITVSILAGLFLVYALYKIILVQEKRDKIAKGFYNWINQPSGIAGRGASKIDADDLRNIAIEEPPQGRNIFATSQFGVRDNVPGNFSAPEKQIDLSGF